MKTNILTAILLYLSAATHAIADDPIADDSIEKKLQQALFAEEGTRDLDKAIEAYQAVIADYDSQRRFAATAVFRLAECYRKKDQKEQAIAAYRRLLDEFSDDQTLTRLAIENLTALGVNAPDDPSALATSSSETAEIARIKQLVALSPDLINDPQSGLLHEAAAKSQLVVANYLIKSGADVNLQSTHKSRHWDTPLDIAAGNGHLAMVKFLLGEGANLGKRAYSRATSRRRTAVLDTLLEKLPEGGGEILSEALGEAVQQSQSSYIEKLLAHGATPSADDLTQTIRLGSVELIRVLLESGVVPDLEQLAEAITTNNQEAVRVLLAAGLKPDAATLNLALNIEHVETDIFDQLWDAGARSENALNYSLATGNTSAALKIIAEIENIDEPSGDKFTPLGLGANQLAPSIIRAALDRGANPDARNPDGSTALTAAIRSDMYIREPSEYKKFVSETIDLLLKAGANIDAQDSEGNTALILAGSKDYVHVSGGTRRRSLPDSAIRLLIAANPDANIRNDEGIAAVNTENELVSRYGALRLAQRADHVWIIENRSMTALSDRPMRLSETLLNRHFSPQLTLYRSGKFDSELLDYSQIVASADPAKDPLLDPGTMVVIEGDHPPSPSTETVRFLQRAAAKRVTISRGDQQWHGMARPGNGPSQTHDPSSHVAYADTVKTLLDYIHAPKAISDLTRIEVEHSDGETIIFNYLIASSDKNADLQLRDGDHITLHAAPPSKLGATILIGRKSELYLRSLIWGQNPDCRLDLAEFIAMAYADSTSVLPSPDFSRISIQRQGKVQEFDFGNLSDEEIPSLEWGDIVNIPPVQDPSPDWVQLDAPLIQHLQKLLARKAQFQVEGGSLRELSIGPKFYKFPLSDDQRSTEALATPGDSQFELLGLSTPMAVRALGYIPSSQLNLAYEQTNDDPELRRVGDMPVQSPGKIIPFPIIESGDRILIHMGAANSRARRSNVKATARIPAQHRQAQPARRVVLPPKSR